MRGFWALKNQTNFEYQKKYNPNIPAKGGAYPAKKRTCILLIYFKDCSSIYLARTSQGVKTLFQKAYTYFFIHKHFHKFFLMLVTQISFWKGL